MPMLSPHDGGWNVRHAGPGILVQLHNESWPGGLLGVPLAEEERVGMGRIQHPACSDVA